jgi:hypothetical protein
LTHGVSHGLRNSDETPSSQSLQAFCPVLRHKYDKFAEKVCSDAGALYFRYADNQMILLNDLSKIDGLLLLLSRNLDRYGLRINQKKVDIWTVNELKTHRFRDIQAIFSETGDNKKPSLVKSFTSDYLQISKEELEKSWNKGIPLLNRLLWANLESLPSHQFDEILDRLTSDKFILLADHKKFERIYKLNSKRKNNVDFIDLLKGIGEKSVHNSFHYEALSFAVLIKNADLQSFFLIANKVTSSPDGHTQNILIYLIYLLNFDH